MVAVAGGVLLLGALILVALALRPPEAPPVSGYCPGCSTAITRVHYGLRETAPSRGGRRIVEKMHVDGLELELDRGSGGVPILWGDCAVPAQETGFVCLQCRRTWVMSPPLPLERSLWWRVRGGLLRML